MRHPLERDLDHVLAHTSEIWDTLRGQSIFITGGTGFVGSWLIESFAWANDRLQLNAQMIVLTRDPEAFGRKAPHAANHASVKILQGTVQNFAYADRKCSFLIHAATDQVASSADEPAGTFDRELGATRRVLAFVREQGVKRVLFTSSGAVYGRQPSEMTHMPEEYAGAPSTVDTNTGYGHAKRASEFLFTSHAERLGFTAVIARLFAFAGPYLPINSNFAIGNFVRDVLVGGPVKIAGDGTPVRSYLYAADLAIWLWHLLVRGEGSRPYNVGSPEEINIADLAELTVQTLSPETPVEIAQKPKPDGPVARYVPCVRRAANELGLRPLIALPEQLRRMYEWNLLQR